jgi:hypothetical protein
MTKFQELREEFKAVLSNRGSRWLDSFFPLLIFLVLSPVAGWQIALWASGGFAVMLALFRILHHQSLVYSLGGLGGVMLAAIFVILIGSEKGFFLPGLISGTITVVLCVVSVALNRPVVAWTSFVARRWPLNWYWHARVLPAYNEVTIAWGVAFAVRLALEFSLYQQEAIGALGAARILLDWPFTILLLIVSYLYGVWRLKNLGGPSVEEFKQAKAPPWESQRRGF